MNGDQPDGGSLFCRSYAAGPSVLAVLTMGGRDGRARVCGAITRYIGGGNVYIGFLFIYETAYTHTHYASVNSPGWLAPLCYTSGVHVPYYILGGKSPARGYTPCNLWLADPSARVAF